MKRINRREFLKRSAGLSLSSGAIATVVTGTLAGSSTAAFAAQAGNESLRSFLVSRDNTVAGITLRHKDKLTRLYSERYYVPFWTKHGSATQTCRAIINKLEQSALYGLHPSHYYTQVLKSWVHLQNPVTAMQMDLVLTDSLYEYFDNLANGQMDVQPGQGSWFATQSKTDISYAVNQFFRGDISFRDAVNTIQPYEQRYTDLLTALAEHHQILNAGGYSHVSSGEVLKIGSVSRRVSQLSARLMQSRDLEHTAISDVFDWRITEGVKNFQQRHGLEADGALGNKTLAELNLPVEQRIAQIEVNLDRWRWLPQNLGASNIVVNTAGFEMDVNLHHNRALSMPVIVGKPDTKTPIFSDVMEHIVFNPSWHVPVSITREKLLPKELSNPGQLDSENFVVVSLSTRDTQPVSSLSSDELIPENFIRKYRLRQLPGKSNALGQVKFMLPNKYSIYLHDTNAKSLFDETTRAFSHGCIRVEDPQQLARTLLLSDGVSDYEIDAIVSSGNTKTVNLREHLPVHITYQTSWVDQYGRVQFRKDIYDHDSHAIQNYQYQRPMQASLETNVLARIGGTITAAAEG